MAELAKLVQTHPSQIDAVASQAMSKLIQAVQDTGKKGSITLKIEISPLKDGDGELQVKPTLKISVPEIDMKMGIYYADDDGKLTRSDPRQNDMFDGGKTIEHEGGTNVSRLRQGL